MRSSLVIATLCVAAAPALADRSSVMQVGLTFDGRARGATWSDAGKKDVSPVGGARVSLSFEDAPVPIPEPGFFSTDTRLVPELFAGFLSDDERAEGYIGAGLRGEVQLASNMRSVNMRTGIYVAARGMIIGKHQDPGAEFVIGEYLERGAGHCRFGWEGGALMRPRPDAAPDKQRELGALISIYVGWR
jgi:hypothetical protein